jgi:small-conductance mechanosensitive channel
MLETTEVAQLFTPYIGILLGLVISLMIKDYATSFIKGIAFRLNPLFSVGDAVIVDGEPAIIVNVGIRDTIFSIEKSGGTSTWLSIPNERIAYLKIEKVIKPTKLLKPVAPSNNPHEDEG